MTFEALDRLIELANADALSNTEFNALVDAVPGLVRVARAAERIDVPHSVVWEDVPNRPSIRRSVCAPDCLACALRSALASLEDADTKGRNG